MGWTIVTTASGSTWARRPTSTSTLLLGGGGRTWSKPCGWLLTAVLAATVGEWLVPLTFHAQAQTMLGGGLFGRSSARDLVEQPHHDFGVVPRGARMTHAFNVANPLSVPLTIERLEASCGCTLVRPEQTTIPPGESSRIIASFDTAKFVGPKQVRLTVTLSDPQGRLKELSLKLSAVIRPDLTLSPGQLDFGRVDPERVIERTLTLARVQGPDDFAPTRMISACRFLDAELTELQRRPGLTRYLLTARLKPGGPAGPFREEIRILTNDPDAPSVTIPVVGEVPEVLVASPRHLALGRLEPGRVVETRVLIRGPAPFRVTGIDGLGDGVECVDPPWEGSAAARPVQFLTLRFTPPVPPSDRHPFPSPPGDWHRVLVVRTDLPAAPSLDLPISATLAHP